MSFIYTNKQQLLENKKYYRNLLGKLTDNDIILNIASDIMFSNNFQLCTINFRFYKIKTFMKNNIKLDIIYHYIKHIVPNDIVFKIIQFYVDDDISFNYINKSSYITTMTINMIYSNTLQLYQSFIHKNDQTVLNEYLYKTYIVKDTFIVKIADKCKLLLNKQTNFDIDDIFKLDSNLIELCQLFKIKQGNIGWKLILN